MFHIVIEVDYNETTQSFDELIYISDKSGKILERFGNVDLARAELRRRILESLRKAKEALGSDVQP